MTTFGIIGAGNIGSQVARAVIAQGHEVVIANSRGPETLAELVADLGPQARAATAQEAAEVAEVAVVTVPLHAVERIPAAPLAGKIVLDTNNYYWERDGRIPALDAGETTTSELVQRHFADAKVVKAFNHIQAAAITAEGQPAGSADRRALVAASDFPEATAFVTALYDGIGFDTVDAGPLAESWRIERDRPGYVVRLTADQLREKLAEAPRTI
ncbi:NADPH-dependent F420 reductase [Arenivirga flava]|uniref:NADP oxidoreductase n=1 Tax=Arenivirga flava TaxID=1930060 RepID=A0AA37XAH9_9MICO|nr:NAD(P)-binding domain-containing protein [Arenivirga flava]GMA27435.1 NADP oxidoreductase [Arenivirga flava]